MCLLQIQSPLGEQCLPTEQSLVWMVLGFTLGLQQYFLYNIYLTVSTQTDRCFRTGAFQWKCENRVSGFTPLFGVLVCQVCQISFRQKESRTYTKIFKNFSSD